MVLTQAELDGILAELGPKIDTDAHRLELGLGAYKELLTAHPEYIKKFTKLQGCTPENVMDGEGIKHYASTLVNDLVEMLKVSTDADALEKIIVRSGNDHKTRDVTADEFKSGEGLFIGYFNSILTKDENKAAMEKFLKIIFPGIAAQI